MLSVKRSKRNACTHRLVSEYQTSIDRRSWNIWTSSCKWNYQPGNTNILPYTRTVTLFSLQWDGYFEVAHRSDPKRINSHLAMVLRRYYATEDTLARSLTDRSPVNRINCGGNMDVLCTGRYVERRLTSISQLWHNNILIGFSKMAAHFTKLLFSPKTSVSMRQSCGWSEFIQTQ